MKNDDLARVRTDLENIQAAIGLPPRWDPREVRVNLLFAAAGVVAAVWALIPLPLSPVAGLLFFAIPVIDWLRAAKNNNDHLASRECRSALRTAWLALPLIALFLWCRQLGLTPLEFLGLAVFLIGMVLFSAAVGEKQGLSLVGWALALMIGGLLLPLQIAPVVAVFAGALALGGLISAALAYAMREESMNHAAG
jgi:hypothetical protein